MEVENAFVRNGGGFHRNDILILNDIYDIMSLTVYVH